MPFNVLPRPLLTHSRGRIVRLYVRNDNGNKSLCLRVQIGATALQESGLAIGDKVTFLLGEGADKGTLRLIKDDGPDSYAIVRAGTGANCGAVKRRGLEGWIDGPQSPVNCTWQGHDGAIDIDLPPWAGGPPLYRDQKIKQLPVRERRDPRGNDLIAISE